MLIHHFRQEPPEKVEEEIKGDRKKTPCSGLAASLNAQSRRGSMEPWWNDGGANEVTSLSI